jgi:hypothetical protein
VKQVLKNSKILIKKGQGGSLPIRTFARSWFAMTLNRSADVDGTSGGLGLRPQ